MEILWQLIPAIIITFVLLSCSFVLLKERRRHDQRVRDLALVSENIDAHYHACEQFLQDESAPPELSKLLVELNGYLRDREMARHFVKFYLVDQSGGSSKEKNDTIDEEIAALSHERPDLLAHFETALDTTLVIMLLRWPETAKQFTEVMARRAMRGVTYVTRVQAGLGSHHERTAFA